MKRISGYLRALELGKIKEYHDARDLHRSGGKYRKKN